MSTKKRLLALAVAGASAVVLGGAFSLAGHTTRVSASGPTTIVVGCANATNGANNPLDVEFPTSSVGGPISGGQETAPTAITPATIIQPINSISLTANGINNLQSGFYLICGAVLQDAAAAAVVPPALPPTNNDQDGNVNTVDQGNVTYVLQNAGGRFAILDNLSTTVTKPCAATAPGVTLTLGAGTIQSDQCLGGVVDPFTSVALGVTGGVTPNPALDVKVGFAAGVPLSSFGSLNGLVGINSGFALTASYTRDPALTAALTSAVAPVATNIGPSTAQATVALGVIAPTYYLSLTANPTTIAAQPNLNIPGVSTPGVAQGGNGQSSLITASLFTGATPLSVPLGGGAFVTLGTTTVAGAEPGTVTFVTNNGIFGTPSSIAASAQQTVAVACGVLPGSNLVYNPQTFSFGTFSFNSCISATTNLFGGGAAGTATVVATFVGSVTGQQAQNAVAVAFSPVANTVNLVRGCNEVITPASLAQNTPIATYLGTINSSSVVVSIWQYNNATQSFGALYFSTPGAPVNGSTIGGNQSVFICVSAGATVGNGAF